MKTTIVSLLLTALLYCSFELQAVAGAKNKRPRKSNRDRKIPVHPYYPRNVPSQQNGYRSPMNQGYSTPMSQGYRPKQQGFRPKQQGYRPVQQPYSTPKVTPRYPGPKAPPKHPAYGLPKKVLPVKKRPEPEKKKGCPSTDLCECEKPFFYVARERLTFYDHVIRAAEVGCHLATASDQYELNEIIHVAIDGGKSISFSTTVNALLPKMWIGLARLSIVNAGIVTDGSPKGAFKWIDGCTPYSFYPFTAGEPNSSGDQDVGTIFFNDDGSGNLQGDVTDSPSSKMYPAVYECCHRAKKHDYYY